MESSRGIVRRWAVENLDPEDIFLELIALSGDGALDDVAEQSAQAGGAGQHVRPEDTVQLRTDFIGRVAHMLSLSPSPLN